MFLLCYRGIKEFYYKFCICASFRMISVSKDGSWKLYDTDIEYEKGQEPYLLKTQQFTVCGFSPTEHQCKVALSSDGCVAAVALLNNLAVFSTTTGSISTTVYSSYNDSGYNDFRDIPTYLFGPGKIPISAMHSTLGITTFRDIRRVFLG